MISMIMSEPKFWGVIIAGFIAFISSQIVLIRTINSQRSMLGQSIRENQRLEEEKANREYEYNLLNERRSKLLEVVNSLISVNVWASDVTRHIAVTSSNKDTIREEHSQVSNSLVIAESISHIYFPDMAGGLNRLRIPLRDFLMCVESQRDNANSEAKSSWRKDAINQAGIVSKEVEIMLTIANTYAVNLKVDNPSQLKDCL